MNKQIGNWFLLGSALFFGFYCLNIALGKWALVSNQSPLIAVGDVWEFVILFLAVVCLVITMLLRESQLKVK